MNQPPSEFLPLLQNAGLAAADEVPVFKELTGGVASDIWWAPLPQGPVCVKRALAKLKVARDWRVPVQRNRYEAAWYETAAGIVPGCAPRVLARDWEAGMFAMEYLEPSQYKPWKADLLEGRIDPGFAGQVGRNLARIHSATAGDDEIEARFPTDEIFHAIRLQPYLEATAEAHPDLAAPLMELSRVTGATHAALVHGDQPLDELVVDRLFDEQPTAGAATLALIEIQREVRTRGGGIGGNSLAILLGGGIDKIEEGEQIAMAMRQRQIKEYIQRVRVAGFGERFDNGRAMPVLQQYVAA